MARRLIVGNWKMNTTLTEAVTLASTIAESLRAQPSEATGSSGVEAVLCPPFISLAAVRDAISDSGIALGAQNLFHEPSGAFTGEVSAAMLAGICQYAIVGHSERRTLFCETDAMLNLKLKASLAAGIMPILCLGESIDEREAGSANRVVEAQLRAALAGVPTVERVIIAYEPVWAIGTGKSATAEVAQDMMAHIRRSLAALYEADEAAQTPLLYGGSVNADNIAGYLSQPDIDGALVGGASLDAKAFSAIVRTAAQF